MSKLNGHCLCEGVAFTVDAPAHLDSCHCGTCRRWSGGPYIGMDFAPVQFTSKASLKWFRSSEWAERGFCSACGSSLFYRLLEDPEKYSICVGALENVPTDLPMTKEYFIDEKPNFYAFEGERERLTGAEVFALYADGEDT